MENEQIEGEQIEGEQIEDEQIEGEQIEGEQNQEPKAKPITFYFYRCSPLEGDNLMKGIALYSGKEVLPDKMIEKAQVQMELPKIEGDLAYGIMRRLRRNSRTKIGNVNRSKSHRVHIGPGQFFIEETYFLYDNRRQVLLYQQNHIGVSCKFFCLYVTQITNRPVEFMPLFTKEALKMLMDDKIKLQKLKIVKFALPTNADLFRDKRNKWDTNMIDMAAEMGGGYLEIILSASIKGASKHDKFLNRHATNYALDLVNNMDPNEGGEATFYDTESGHTEVVDLVEGRLKSVVSADEVENITQDGQFESSDIFEIMKEKMEIAQSKLDGIFGPRND